MGGFGGILGALAGAPPVHPVSSQPTGGGSGSNVATQIIELAKLKAQGLLTDEEFAAAKAKALSFSKRAIIRQTSVV